MINALEKYIKKTSPPLFSAFSVKLYKIGAANISSSMMPAGMKAEDMSLKPILIQPGNQVVNKLFSLSMATSPEDLVSSNVAGKRNCFMA